MLKRPKDDDEEEVFMEISGLEFAVEFEGAIVRESILRFTTFKTLNEQRKRKQEKRKRKIEIE